MNFCSSYKVLPPSRPKQTQALWSLKWLRGGRLCSRGCYGPVHPAVMPLANYSQPWELKANNGILKVIASLKIFSWNLVNRFFSVFVASLTLVLFAILGGPGCLFFLCVWLSHSLRVFSQLLGCLSLKFSGEHSLQVLSSLHGLTL